MTQHLTWVVFLAMLSLDLLTVANAVDLTNPSPSRSPISSLIQSNLIAQRLGFTVRNSRPSRNQLPNIARGGCVENGTPADVDLIPLVTPTASDVAERGEVEVELTTSEHPTLFVYISSTTVKQISVDLQSDQGEILYEARLELPESTDDNHGKIVEIPIPETVEPLEVNGIYSWSVSLLCNSADANPLIEGWIQRIEDPELTLQLNQADERSHPTLYAAAGVWHDTIASLANLRKQHPGDTTLVEDWESLLDSVDLEGVADAPIVQLMAEPAAIETGLILPRN